MTRLLEGKNAIVTGANRGIGRAVIEVFAEHGANLWACARRPDDPDFERLLHELAIRHDVSAEAVELDLDDDESIKAASRTITKQKRPIDILVNNAGSIDTALFAMTPLKSMRGLYQTNLFGPLAFTQKLIRPMIKRSAGSIVNLSSSAAIEANAGRTAYASAKAALITATRVMSRELGAHNIRVNAVAPGLTETDMMRDSTPDDIVAETLDRVSLKRVAEPEEIARAILFLASDLASYVTGETLSVDGGM